AADFLAGYAERRKECIHELNTEIERRIQALILHIPQLEHVRVVEAVKRLYLERLLVGSRVVSEPTVQRAEELRLTKTIAAAVEHVYQSQPARAAQFVAKLDLYENWLTRLRLSEGALAGNPQKRRLAGLSLLWALLAVAGAPVAGYGWLHRLTPILVVRWAVNRFADVQRHKAQSSTAAII